MNRALMGIIGVFLFGVFLTGCTMTTALTPEEQRFEDEFMRYKAQKEHVFLEERGEQLENTPPAAVSVSTPIPAKPAVLPAASGNELIVLDFNSGSKPNNLGGDLGAWDKDPKDKTQSCDIEFVEGTGGYVLKIAYDVDSKNPAYNGFWTKLEGTDWSSYSALTIAIKGESSTGFTKKCKLELKDSSGNVARFMITGITDAWTDIVIPFKRLYGINRLDLSSMGELVLVFDDQTSNPKVGVIYIDNVRVTK